MSSLFWTAWKTTGDDKYPAPAMRDYKFAVGVSTPTSSVFSTNKARLQGDPDGYGGHETVPDGANDGGFLKWQISHDKNDLVQGYTSSIQYADATEYIYTLGSLWIDRVSERFPFLDLQRSRLGGDAAICLATRSCPDMWPVGNSTPRRTTKAWPSSFPRARPQRSR